MNREVNDDDDEDEEEYRNLLAGATSAFVIATVIHSTFSCIFIITSTIVVVVAFFVVLQQSITTMTPKNSLKHVEVYLRLIRSITRVIRICTHSILAALSNHQKNGTLCQFELPTCRAVCPPVTSASASASSAPCEAFFSEKEQKKWEMHQ